MPVTSGAQTSGTVGDLVPILAAELAAAPAPVAPQETKPPPQPPRIPDMPAKADVPAPPAPPAPPALPAPTWEGVPPPVRLSAARRETPPHEVPQPETAKPLGDGSGEREDEAALADGWFPEESDEPSEPMSAGARELGPGSWAAPPLRRPDVLVPDGDSVALAMTPSSAAAAPVATAVAKKARRRSRWLVAALLLVLAGGLSLAGLAALRRQAGNEAELFKAAEREYHEHRFADAAVLFQNLQRDFPGSEQRALYRFLGELSAVREAIYFPGEQGHEGSLGRIGQFLDYYKGDALLKSHEQDIWKTLHKLGKELGEDATAKKDRALLLRARTAFDVASRLGVAQTPQNREMLQRARDALLETEKHIIEREQRDALIARVTELVATPSSQTVQRARQLVAAAGRDSDAELKELLQRLLTAHIGQVAYTPLTAPAAFTLPPGDEGTSLLITLAVGKVVPLSMKTRTVFALARGVLYALDGRDGQLRWARRVGIDNQHLPVRLPATSTIPELAIIVSTDDRTLSAVAVNTGEVAWQHVLDEPCLGQPVLMGARVLAATYSGRVEEIDAGSGKLLGFFRLGEPLSAGMARQDGSPLLYVPAESYAIYVLDVEKHACERILYSRQARGALRSPPLIVTEPGKSAGLMVLEESDGLDTTRLRAYSLPIRDPDQKSLPVEQKIRGWTWFAPFQDGERLLSATDAGMLGYWGIRQKGNRDSALFPWFKKELMIAEGKANRSARGLVAHADAENVWTISNGRLQRWRIAFHPKDGPQLSPAWSESLLLGIPIQETQVLRDDEGNAIQFFVTHDLRTASCLASAVHAADGRVLWQRRLGALCQGQPVAIGKQILLGDPSGLLSFADSDAKERWQQAGRMVVPSPGGKAMKFLILPGRDQQPGCVLGVSADGSATEIRVQPLDAAGNPLGQPKSHVLPASLSGTPALGPEFVVLPLANGILERVPLNEGLPVHGPGWRKSGADENALCHVRAVDGHDFLVSDGSNGLMRLHWSEPKSWEKKASVQLPARVVAPPIVVAGPAGEGIAVAVACADQSLNVLDGGRLTVSRTWAMPGKVTAGPFAHGRGIGCVVERNRLVWVDPSRKQPWERSFDADIIGVPLWTDDTLVVANQAGQVVALLPEDGRPLGPGYSLRANITPAAAPVPFADSSLFLPLTDGTVIILPRKLLR